MSSLPRHRIRQFDIVHYGRLQDSPAFEVFRQLQLEAFYAFARRKTDVRRAEQALFSLARGKFRFFTLADEVLTQNAQDREGRFRAYAFRLGDLELPPLFLDDMAAAVLEPGAVEPMRQFILRAEAAQGLENILMSNSHWQAFMKHRHLSEHDQLFTEFFDYSPLEGETTQDYKTGGEALQKDYLKQRDEWLRTLTRKVLPGLIQANSGAGQD